jgi:hypothetical protein
VMCQAIALTLDAVSAPRHAATDGSANSGKLAMADVSAALNEGSASVTISWGII